MRKVLAILMCLVILGGCASSPSQTEETKAPEVKEATVGGSVENEDLKITLDSVTRYVDTSELKMDTPAEGKEFILLNLTAENISSEDQHINMFYEESYVDDTAIDPQAIMYGIDDKESFFGDVAAGKKRTGYIAYEVDVNWQKIEFIYKPDPFNKPDVKFTFTATKADVK